MSDLWPLLARGLVAAFAALGIIPLNLDDTLFHKTGRRIQGAGIFRDAVRSSGKAVVYALGLNLVVLTLRVTPPWGGEPLGLPIGVRLYRKGGPSHLDLAAQMLRAVAAWFPDRCLALCCDGACASLAGRRLRRTQVTSRMRRDAALYELPPKRRQGQRGRPAKKGKRLPTPEQLARRARKGWTRVQVDMRGRQVERLILSRQVLWYSVCPDRCVRLVIVRDPEGKQPDDFFFSTELEDASAVVAGRYNGRWSIEVAFKALVQALCGFCYHFWMKAMAKRERGAGDQYLHRADPDYRQQVYQKIEAYERFVNISAIGLGILQILAITHAQKVWAHFPLWLRTLPQHDCPSENVVRLTLQHDLHRISLGSTRGLMLAKILRHRARVDRNRDHPLRLMAVGAAR